MFIRRHNVILGVMVLLLVCMAGYLATRYARYDFRGDLPHDLEQRIARAKLGSKIVTTLPARPGDVYGRGLQTPIIMAASRQVPSCFIDPSLIKKTIKVGETEQLVDDKEALCELLFDLARILKLSVGDLNVHLALRKEEYAFAQERSYRQKLAAWREAPDGPKPKKKSTELRFCWIKHELTRAELDALKTWKTDLAKRAKLATKTMADDVGQAYRKTQRNKTRAVGIQYEWRRSYPNGSCGATVLGYLNRNNEPGGGIHSSMANLLLSKDGRMVQYADVKRRAYKVDVKESEMPQDGCNIYLSIDLNIQNTLEKNIARACKKFEAQWGTGVVINPWTGDILAMANVPNYDPNLYNILPREEHHRMLNRAICMPYEPGSIFKPMIAASAVQLGTVNWDTIIDTGNGTYHAPRGGRISDHGARYGKISVRTGVVKSSNILMALARNSASPWLPPGRYFKRTSGKHSKKFPMAPHAPTKNRPKGLATPRQYARLPAPMAITASPSLSPATA